jgi:RNA polymerase sigma factor (sigma-70 family)
MSDDHEFRALLVRLRAGDQRAATELVQKYGPVVRSVIQVRLRESHLRRYFDSMDVFQSVMCKFFRRAADGQFEIEHPAQLVKLLVAMTRNAFIDRVRREKAGVRPLITAGDEALDGAIDANPDARPSVALNRRDLVEKVEGLMSPSVLRLAQPWAEGHGWREIAQDVGGTPDALRVKFGRALERVRTQLAQDEFDLTRYPEVKPS